MNDPVSDILFQDDYLRVRPCRRGIFAYSVNDIILGRSLDLYGEWFEPHLELMLEIISDDDVVIDVGANIGPHTIAMATKLQPTGGMVFAYEPQRLVFQNLCANISLNRLFNVFAHHAVVGAKPGKKPVPTLHPQLPQSTTGVDLRQTIEGEETPMIRLDDLLIGRCKLLKIDVEGMEPDVLDGAKKLLANTRPVLVIEATDLAVTPAILKRVFAAGYHSWWHIADYYNPNNFRGNADNIFNHTGPKPVLFCFHQSLQAQLPHLIPVTGPDDNWQKALSRVTL